MDGVLFKDVNFWMELHRVFGTLEEGKILTKKYLHTDYQRLVEEVVVNLWKDKEAEPYFNLIKDLEYLPGIKELFTYIKNQDFITAIISASSIDAARRVQKEFGIDHIYANELIIRNGKITGEFIWPIAEGGVNKAKIVENLCEEFNISPEEVIFVGDSINDVEASKVVGLSIAFNTDCEELKQVATHVIDSNDLRDVIKILPK